MDDSVEERALQRARERRERREQVLEGDGRGPSDLHSPSPVRQRSAKQVATFHTHGRSTPGWRPPRKGSMDVQPSLMQEVTSQLMRYEPPSAQFWDPATVTWSALWGLMNLTYVMIAVAALRVLLLNYLRSEPILDMEFLEWSLEGAVDTLALYALMVLGSLSVFALHWLAAHQYISVPLREMLYRFASGMHLLVPYKVFLNRSLSPVPAFFIALQSMVLLLKHHSYYTNVRALQIDSGGLHPERVRLRDFLYFLVVPTLVYRVDGYPKSPKIRPLFLVRRTLQALGCMFLIYEVVVYSMLPEFKRVNQVPTLQFVVDLMMPAVLLWMLLFVATFEVILNVFAELTYFGDRRFYDDWWNSTNLGEFSRKWNRPVHDWLYMHVYRPLLRRGYGKAVAQSCVFLFSAIFHELILSITFRRVRIYLFALMMLQIPMITATSGLPLHSDKHRWMRRAANIWFWFGMFLGPALLFLIYCKDYYQEHEMA